jgi:hypothetical protein
MPSNPNQFENIIHFKNKEGTLCNSTIAKKFSDKEDEVTCNKCKKFLDHPKMLETSRRLRKEWVESEKQKLQIALGKYDGDVEMAAGYHKVPVGTFKLLMRMTGLEG